MSERSAGRPVFDASAVLALLGGEAGSEKLAALQADAVLGAVNAAEVLAKLVSRGMPLMQAKITLNALHIEIVPFEAEMASDSARHVRRNVSLGDRCFLATAHRHGPGWTSDRELVALPGAKLRFFR